LAFLPDGGAVRPAPDRLIRDNPALLLSALQAPDIVAGLVAEWNPAWRGGFGPATAPTVVGEGIRWHGPIRLTPMLRADAGLPSSGSAASLGLAYVAEVRRERTKIGDSRHADRLRLRYPYGLPAGAEAQAWHLVRGLARRLRGVASLPGGPVHVPHEDLALPGDTDHAVYSHEMLPWTVLRELLRPYAPGLAREVLPDGGGYILRQRDLVEIRIRPANPANPANPGNQANPRNPGNPTNPGNPANPASHGHRPHHPARSTSVSNAETPASGSPASGSPKNNSTHLPHALRNRADAAWPRSVYEFCDLSTPLPDAAPATTPAACSIRSAAALIAEVTGGVHLDADGFPQETRTFTTR
jgi:hypothetical protein